MKRVLAAGLCACLLLVSGCTPSVAETPATAPAVSTPSETPTLPTLLTDAEELAALLEEVNAKNAATDAPVADLDKYRYDFESGKPLFTPEDDDLIESLDEVKEFPETITREEAKTEIDWYLRLLRTRYGLYTFFGGDEVFDGAKEALYAKLDAGADRLNVQGEYAPMLREALGMIRDKHFNIGNAQQCPSSVLLGGINADFQRRGDSFYGGEAYEKKILSIDGQPPETYMKRAISQEGALVWTPYLRVPAEEAGIRSALVAYEGGETEYITMAEASAASKNISLEETLVQRAANNIYTVRMNRMVMGDPADGPYTEGDDVIREQFLKTAQTARNYAIAVFDLRDNSGGNGALPGEWFAAYTGEPLQQNYCSLALRRELDGSYSKPEREDGFIARGWLVDGNYYVKLPTPQFVDAEGPLLIVRTSKSTASAAENFTDMAHNLKNTLVVGAPTSGALTGDMAWFGVAMPWSKLNFSYGVSLFYWDSNYFSEGVGLEPDLYLTGNNVDERLTLFLERYVLRD